VRSIGPLSYRIRPIRGFREAEVQQFHGAVGLHLDVGGLDVAVDDSLFVRALQRLRDLFRDRQCVVDGNGARREPLGEIFTIDPLHDECVDLDAPFDRRLDEP
jgi:hypothetical protein